MGGDLQRSRLLALNVMIWFRRILTIPLIILFLVVFVVVLLVTQVSDTFGSPGFYTDQLREADIYNFLYDEVVPAALDEIETENPSDMPIDIEAVKDEAVSTAREVLPPEWLQAQVESGINAMLPYIVGDTDEFSYTVTFKDRIETAADVIKEDTLHSDAFTSVYNDGVTYLAEQLLENLDELPYTLSLSEAEVEDSLKSAMPIDWMRSQGAAAIDSAMPYFTGDSDHFTLTIQVEDRVDAVAEVAVDLFSGQETYDYLLEEMITPMVAANLGEGVNLPYGVSLTQEEIASAIKQVLPQAWVEARLEEVVSTITAYVKGESDTMEVAIGLADRKAAALDVLTGLADQKLSALFQSLPTCSMAEFLLAVQSLPPGQVPSCRPTGVSYEEFKTTLNIDIQASIEQMIGDQMPDQWLYTDADLRQSLGEGNEDVLDELRDTVSDGWEYTDADLLEELNSDEEQTLNDFRDWTKNGYTVTEADLTDAAADADVDMESIDETRHWIGTGRTWLWAAWIIPFLGLVCIGFLGGRNWRSRLSWALAVLLLASLAVYLVISFVYPSVGEPRLQDIMLDSSEYEGLAAQVADKGNEVIENSVGAFLDGIHAKTLYMMIGSAVVIVGVICWSVVRARERVET